MSNISTKEYNKVIITKIELTSRGLLDQHFHSPSIYFPKLRFENHFPKLVAERSSNEVAKFVTGNSVPLFTQLGDVPISLL